MKKISIRELAQKYKLVPNEMMTYIIINAATNEIGFFDGGYDFLVARTNLSRRSITTAIKKLIDIGLIEREYVQNREVLFIAKEIV